MGDRGRIYVEGGIVDSLSDVNDWVSWVRLGGNGFVNNIKRLGLVGMITGDSAWDLGEKREYRKGIRVHGVGGNCCMKRAWFVNGIEAKE